MQTTKRGQKEGSSQNILLTQAQIKELFGDDPVPVRRKEVEARQFAKFKRENLLVPQVSTAPENSGGENISVTEIDLDKE